MAAEGITLVKLGFDGFAKLLGYFGRRRNSAKLKRQIDAAWKELLKGDAADNAVIESALAAAREAKDTSTDHHRLVSRYSTARASKRKASGTAKKKAAGKSGAKRKASKKKAPKRK